MLTKDQKDKLRTLWKGGLAEKDRATLIQVWELLEAIDPDDSSFKKELLKMRDKVMVSAIHNLKEDFEEFAESTLGWYLHDQHMFLDQSNPVWVDKKGLVKNLHWMCDGFKKDVLQGTKTIQKLTDEQYYGLAFDVVQSDAYIY